MTDFSVTPQSTPVAAQDALHTPGMFSKPESSVEDRRQALLRVHVPGNLVPSEDAYRSAIDCQQILEERIAKILQITPQEIRLRNCIYR
eukprot:symbB.v1.2.042753.t1/scaffold10929.1/size1441/1